MQAQCGTELSRLTFSLNLQTPHPEPRILKAAKVLPRFHGNTRNRLLPAALTLLDLLLCRIALKTPKRPRLALDEVQEMSHIGPNSLDHAELAGGDGDAAVQLRYVVSK